MRRFRGLRGSAAAAAGGEREPGQQRRGGPGREAASGVDSRRTSPLTNRVLGKVKSPRLRRTFFILSHVLFFLQLLSCGTEAVDMTTRFKFR